MALKMGSELFTASGNTATENKAKVLRAAPYGIHNGCWNKEKEAMTKVDQMTEKSTDVYVEEHLGVKISY